MSEITLFALPFAGGSKFSYQGISKYLPQLIDFKPLDLPGRGMRTGEQLLTSSTKMVDDVIAQMKEVGLEKPYAIYGHSMGSLLGYLTVHELQARQLPLPQSLVFTGARGPSVPLSENKRYLLPRDQFIARLRSMGGSPDEVLQDEAIMEFYEPILRADFQAIETHDYETKAPFDIPLTVVTGTQELVSKEQGMAWQKETTEPLEYFQLPGKHFFIFDHPFEMARIITNRLRSVPVVN